MPYSYTQIVKMIKKQNKVWIIIPCHNEEKNLGSVLAKCKKYVNNIIVVDDGSTDHTYEVAEKANVYCLKHIVNMGKGAAARTGCDFALKNKAEKIILIDGDGQHDPGLIPVFLKHLEKCDIVIGVRHFNKKMPTILRFGNNFINFIICILFQIKISDSQSGYRAFWAKHYRKIKWRSMDYSMESEMIANLAKHKLKLRQLKIKTIYQDNYKGTTILDGVRIIYNLLKWRVNWLIQPKGKNRTKNIRCKAK